MLKMQKNKFELPISSTDYGEYEGYHDPKVVWNGWECPMFKKEVVEKILSDLNLKFYWVDHVLVYTNQDGDMIEERPYAVECEGENIWAYGVGSWYFIWNVATDTIV